MRLTAYTDYALRTLMYLAIHRDRLATVQEIADEHGIARNHLTKIVHHLGMLGYVETVRGRHGGLRLGRDAASITIGEVVRHTETDFHMAACFDQASSGCSLVSACGLKGTLARATQAFLAELDGATLESMAVREERKKRGAPGTPRVIELHMGRGAGGKRS
ncbi:MAG: Rrf2 family transcriptional regulator [Gammaproteobacteria bacterium]